MFLVSIHSHIAIHVQEQVHQKLKDYIRYCRDTLAEFYVDMHGVFDTAAVLVRQAGQFFIFNISPPGPFSPESLFRDRNEETRIDHACRDRTPHHRK